MWPTCGLPIAFEACSKCCNLDVCIYHDHALTVLLQLACVVLGGLARHSKTTLKNVTNSHQQPATHPKRRYRCAVNRMAVVVQDVTKMYNNHPIYYDIKPVHCCCLALDRVLLAASGAI